MGLRLIDTHSHLYAKEFDDDLDDVLQRLEEQGIHKVLLPNVDRASVDRLNNLVARNPDRFIPMMGLHPCSVQPEDYRDQLALVESMLFANTFCAVGEIGMDLYWDKSTQDIQVEAFKQQCHWAHTLGLPVAIHSRNATHEVIQAIKELQLPGLTGVFHCFGDGLQEANEIIEMGFKLGIGGVLTFKNSGLDKVLENIDLEHLVLETDAPYLAPVPHRGKRNESSYTYLIAQKLADVKRTTIEQVAKITTANAEQLFGI